MKLPISINQDEEEVFTYQVKSPWRLSGSTDCDPAVNFDTVEEAGLDYAIALAERRAEKNREVQYVYKRVAKVTPLIPSVEVKTELTVEVE